MTQVGPQIRQPLEPLRAGEPWDMVQPGPEQEMAEPVVLPLLLSAIDEVFKKKKEANKRCLYRDIAIIATATIALSVISFMPRPYEEGAPLGTRMQSLFTSGSGLATIGIALATGVGHWLNHKLSAREVMAIGEA